MGVLGAIPYHTFPELLTIGGFTLRTFGLMVGIGVLTAAWFAGSYGERIGVSREETYRLATRLVVAGVIGSRLAWDITNWDQIENPIDLIAMWEGGLQFTGGFALATVVALPTVWKWPVLRKWRMADVVAPRPFRASMSSATAANSGTSSSDRCSLVTFSTQDG